MILFDELDELEEQQKQSEEGQEQELRVTVTIDRELGVSQELEVRRGSTILDLKVRLAGLDLTGQCKVADLEVCRADPAGAERGVLPDCTVVTEAHVLLELRAPLSDDGEVSTAAGGSEQSSVRSCASSPALDGAQAPAEVQIERHTSPHSLSLQQARAVQVHLVREFASREFQDSLHEAWNSAASDPVKQQEDCKLLCSQAEVRLAGQQGFAASAAGAAALRAALLPYLGVDAEMAHRAALLRWLMDPEVQRNELIPRGPARCTIFATAEIHSRVDMGHICKVEVHLNDTVRCLKENIYLTTRVSWAAQRLFLGAVELLDQAPLSRYIRVAGSTAFLLEYREPHVVQWLARLKKEGVEILRSAPAELIADKQFMLPAVQVRAQALAHASAALRADRQFLLGILQHCGQALQWVADELRGDMEIVLAAVRQDAWSLEYASHSLQGDRSVVLAAVRQDAWALQFAAPSLRTDTEIVLAATKNDPSIILKVLPELQADRRAVIQAVQQDWHLLESLPPEMRDDREVVLAAVRQSGWALQHASAARRADREVVRCAVQSHGDALRFASEDLYGDREVVLAAVRQSGVSLGLAALGVQDMEIATAAVRQDKRALIFVAPSLRAEVAQALGLTPQQQPGGPEAPEGSGPRPSGGGARGCGTAPEDRGTGAGAGGRRRGEELGPHLAALGLAAGAGREEIKRRYHRLARQYHPDKYQGDAEVAKQTFQRISKAYEALRAALDF